jgi:hypothetical protein
MAGHCLVRSHAKTRDRATTGVNIHAPLAAVNDMAIQRPARRTLFIPPRLIAR